MRQIPAKRVRWSETVETSSSTETTESTSTSETNETSKTKTNIGTSGTGERSTFPTMSRRDGGYLPRVPAEAPQGGQDEFKKNRHFYPLLVQFGVEALSDADAEEIQARLSELGDLMTSLRARADILYSDIRYTFSCSAKFRR